MHARRMYSRLFPNHTRAGTRWSSFLYEKGSPRGNLAHVLVVHLVEGGSSTTGEQTNCDLTCYVKKRGKPCGAYLRGKALYTGVLLMCPVNSQNEEKLPYYAISPAHGRGGSQYEVKLAYYALRPLPRPCARWLTGRGEKFTTPSVYSSSLLLRL